MQAYMTIFDRETSRIGFVKNSLSLNTDLLASDVNVTGNKIVKQRSNT